MQGKLEGTGCEARRGFAQAPDSQEPEALSLELPEPPKALKTASRRLPVKLKTHRQTMYTCTHPLAERVFLKIDLSGVDMNRESSLGFERDLRQ